MLMLSLIVLQTARKLKFIMSEETKTASNFRELHINAARKHQLTSNSWSPMISSINSSSGFSALLGTRAANTAGSSPALDRLGRRFAHYVENRITFGTPAAPFFLSLTLPLISFLENEVTDGWNLRIFKDFWFRLICNKIMKSST